MAVERGVMGGGESARSAASLQMPATNGQPAAGHTIALPLALFWGYWGPQPHADLPALRSEKVSFVGQPAFVV